MDAKNYWRLFMETGAPEMYLMYTQMRRQEANDVFENPGPGCSGHSVQ